MKIGKIAVVALMVSGCGSEDNVQSVTESVSNEAVSETNTATEETGAERNLLVHDAAGMNSENNELSFPLGQAINSDAFTGTAYIEAMINYDDIYNFPQTNNIIFEPGARSSWHTHGGSANTSFAHIAVNTNPEMTGLEWFERITDEEYAQLETEK